jgi:hypothetical protein
MPEREALALGEDEAMLDDQNFFPTTLSVEAYLTKAVLQVDRLLDSLKPRITLVSSDALPGQRVKSINLEIIAEEPDSGRK